MKVGKLKPPVPAVSRRELMKMGAAVVLTTPTSQNASEQGMIPQPATRETHAGWKNESGRASGNGPMDDTTRKLVTYASSFSEANLKFTEPLVEAIGDTMVDSIGCVIAGFESEPARIGAGIARLTQSEFKSTVLGYGVTTSPELAAFVNTSMLRHTDFNDVGTGKGRGSEIIMGILAVAEAVHSTGSHVLAAVALGYEILDALSGADASGGGGWDRPYVGPATALAAGKLLALNEDQLANALSLSLVPYLPLHVSQVGTLSMWKGCRTATAVRNAIFSAILARQGMTGPCQPFEGRDGFWDKVSGPFKELRLPFSPDGRMAVQRMRYKRFPAEGDAQAILEVVPQIREWTSVDDIASIQIELTRASWLEMADPPKWDPQNRETADHSIPYMFAIAMTDGEVYLSSFTIERIKNDQSLRQLMQKITARENPDFSGNRSRITVRTKMGGELTKDVIQTTPMSHEEIVAKFNRICAFKSVTGEMRDRTLGVWSDLRSVTDIAEPMRALAHFGQPLPL